ncbi:YceH family protein [Pseudomarimonas arenosa]|uniref:DUF480 domain-containing protein n=1 Tax=Pseudomarimonas arenosa TaxID=2774145 RepID=A0AAW3ZG83_9GAMM|nr:DUF480 domain-containing protein [Pseudomarimonas arenosa]MBD8524172.1 DUF480 domain-containing protein [Pseudomarimonas arenosa]
MSEQNAELTPIEARILGCLIEKEATTPDQYPLTENAIVVACNQKTSRDPVMNLSPGEVGHALRQMENRRLVRSQHGARAQRYEHRMSDYFGLTQQQQALLALLILRGPQTGGELLSRSDRLAKFSDAEDLRHCLQRLQQREPSLVKQLGRAPGQREDRYGQLLTGPIDESLYQTSTAVSASSDSVDMLLQRIEALEARVAELEQQVQG